jgi:hypothetical protein
LNTDAMTIEEGASLLYHNGAEPAERRGRKRRIGGGEEGRRIQAPV